MQNFNFDVSLLVILKVKQIVKNFYKNNQFIKEKFVISYVNKNSHTEGFKKYFTSISH